MPSAKAIVVCGPVGSGKSTLAQSLRQSAKLEYYGIDDYRGHRSMKDIECHRELMSDLWKANDLILECTGAGRFFPQYLSILRKRNYSILMVRLKCPYAICKRNIKSRPNDSFSLSSYDFIESSLEQKRFDITIDTYTTPLASQVNAVMQAFLSSYNI